MSSPNQPIIIPFKWQYIALPLGLLLVTVIVVAIFYAQLPAQIGYHFQGSEVDRTMAKGTFIMWMVVPHIALVLLAFSITRIAMLGARYAPPGETPLLQLLPVMGNMAALPQIVLFIAMLQLFLYNVYNTGIIPLWIITLIIMVAGIVILFIIFRRIIKQFKKKKTTNTQE